MSRAYEDAMDRRRDEYVAGALGISAEVLEDYPFELDENASHPLMATLSTNLSSI